MPYCRIHYYQTAVADGNFRTIQGARDARLGVQELTADGAANAAPEGAVFALVETDTNMRYTVTPKAIEASGAAVLPDGQPVSPNSLSPCFPAAAFSMQGPISVEGGDIIRVAFG